MTSQLLVNAFFGGLCGFLIAKVHNLYCRIHFITVQLNTIYSSMDELSKNNVRIISLVMKDSVSGELND